MGNRSRRPIPRVRAQRWPRRAEPPGVMWPSEDSGFEASPYSPAGQIQSEAQAIENAQEDPVGVWRAIRASWGLRIILGGFAFLALVAGVSALLHL